MEIIRIDINSVVFHRLYDQNLITKDDFKLVKVFVKDDMFINDGIHAELVKEVMRAKSKLEEYEFNKRHKIKK